jgi:preprotein translocase subunit SecE
MNRNPMKRNALLSLFVTVLFTVMIFVPGLLGVDGFDWGYAFSFLSLFVAVSAAVVSVLFFNLARRLDALLRGEGVLAHWTYEPKYWSEYTKTEYETEKSQKKGLFLVVAAFALFFGVLFWVLDSEAGFIVFLSMLGLIGVVGFAWRFSAWTNYKQNLNGIREAYITKDAIYLNQKMYSWRGPLARFVGVSMESSHGVTVLAFKYSTETGRAGPQTYVTRVPVPKGQEETASKIIQAFLGET